MPSITKTTIGYTKKNSIIPKNTDLPKNRFYQKIPITLKNTKKKIVPKMSSL